MNSDLQQRAEEIFTQVLDQPAGERTRMIDARCGDDANLKAEVRLLLKFLSDGGDGFLNPEEIRQLTAAGSGLETPMADEPRLAPGTKVAGYTIRDVLGAGGMGIVYLAEQERPKRTVALKVIRRGMGGSGLLRRFEHEAEVLGRLHHPGIAQIYEAGTAAMHGVEQPFIAMEYVEGLTLTAYAHSRTLSTRERLTLMAAVCDAVHHAHQRGVIHRDLKPGNIMVVGVAGKLGESGQPKILDFGVARAVHADIPVTTVRTSIGQLIGTLAYMSPEQVVGEPSEIDTRSDVYALGVILYELLAGRLPHDLASRSLPEAARTIRHDPHTRLSSVSRAFRGEIETIVSEALDKDKARRYQSAADLGEDIRRYLAGDPIHARHDSALYILRKQLRRYRWPVAAGIAALIGLIGFSIYAGLSAEKERVLAAKASEAQKQAVTQRDIASDANTRLEKEVQQARIERGRLEAAVGNQPLAEDYLWRAYFENPESLAAQWGLWEMHKRTPLRWTVQSDFGGLSGAIAPDRSFLLVGTDSGMLVMHDMKSGRELRHYKGLGAAVRVVAVSGDSSTALVCGQRAWFSSKRRPWRKKKKASHAGFGPAPDRYFSTGTPCLKSRKFSNG